MRKDIQALRAIAVLSVLLYHLWPGRLAGGFVGVDIFFVISGYLITGHLVKELFASGTIKISRFYSRRAVRLLPSALLVLVTTGIVTWFFADQSVLETWMPQLASSAFYVENWHLANLAVDYLGSDTAPSPVQHFWTLSVEEQFYILMPVILILVAKLAKKFKVSAKTAVISAVALITVASLIYGIYLTIENQPLAYFNTFTRAWEFALGALVAIVPLKQNLKPRLLQPLALVLFALSFVYIRGDQNFPGYIALLPVIGAVLWLIASPAKTSWFDKALAPIGDISYSIYLWHWPAIVLLPFITYRELTTIDKLGIIAFSLAAAWVSTHLYENRIRFSEKLAVLRKPKVTAIWATALMTIIAVISLQFLPQESSDQTSHETNTMITPTSWKRCLGAGSLDPANQPCDFSELKGLLTPSPGKLKEDDSNRRECWTKSGPGLKVCVLGVETGYTKHFYAIGDSHNNVFIDAFEQIAKKNHWRIDLTGRGSCYWTTAPLKLKSKTLDEDCIAWRKDAVTTIASFTDLDGILVTHDARSKVWADNQQETIINGLVEAWNARPDLNVPVIALLDNPTMNQDVIYCVARYRLEANDHCNNDIKLVSDGQAEAAAIATNVKVIDLRDYYCPNGKCMSVIGHVVVYRDARAHLTNTFAKSLAPYIEAGIKTAIGKTKN
ncbi:MAG: acyltransferase family protein [Micrococcales bacterium]